MENIKIVVGGVFVNSSFCYTMIICILNFVMILLTILYFATKLPEHHPYKNNMEEDLLKNYEVIKYQKRTIRSLKIRLFLITVFTKIRRGK